MLVSRFVCFTSTLQEQCQVTCGWSDNEPAHKNSPRVGCFQTSTLQECQDIFRLTSIQNVIFPASLRKIMGNVDPKMGCKIWTPFWGPPNCFFFSRAPKRGPDFRPHFGVHIARFFRSRDAQKNHPRVGCL